MKKLLSLVLGLCVVYSIAAFAQDAPASAGTADKSTASTASLKTLKGTVKAEGDKVTFTSDADQKSWDVENPEVLKAHDGHHVQVSAHVDADKGTIHVTSVKMLKKSSM
ncbi:MAG TPA: hypothetical protein VIW67_23070 [Terriglobales bacterium]|jgi:hypothetical protein